MRISYCMFNVVLQYHTWPGPTFIFSQCWQLFKLDCSLNSSVCSSGIPNVVLPKFCLLYNLYKVQNWIAEVRWKLVLGKVPKHSVTCLFPTEYTYFIIVVVTWMNSMRQDDTHWHVPDTESIRRHRHSIPGHLSSYLTFLAGLQQKAATAAAAAVPVFSTAVISGSTSAPDLRDNFPALPFTSSKLTYVVSTTDMVHHHFHMR